MDAHAATCRDCAALLSGIASVVAEARALPELAPSRDLWRGIEARIAAPVIALDAAAPRRQGAAAVRRAPSWTWMGAAAAALVVATAGITYTATRSMLDGAAVPEPVAEIPTPSTGPDSALPAGRVDDPRLAPAATVADRGTGSTGGARDASPRADDIGVARVATPASSGPAIAGAAAFDAEIGQLRSVLERRRTELDPATVAILEYNLDVIDQAIDQSRAAIARDPANQFLTEQLNATLGKKVELLRTAAMLPARL
jgi:hypothetical protein